VSADGAALVALVSLDVGEVLVGPLSERKRLAGRSADACAALVEFHEELPEAAVGYLAIAHAGAFDGPPAVVPVHRVVGGAGLAGAALKRMERRARVVRTVAPMGDPERG